MTKRFCHLPNWKICTYPLILYYNIRIKIVLLPKMKIIIHLQKRGQKRIRTTTHQRPGETAAPKDV